MQSISLKLQKRSSIVRQREREREHETENWTNLIDISNFATNFQLMGQSERPLSKKFTKFQSFKLLTKSATDFRKSILSGKSLYFKVLI